MLILHSICVLNSMCKTSDAFARAITCMEEQDAMDIASLEEAPLSAIHYHTTILHMVELLLPGVIIVLYASFIGNQCIPLMNLDI